MKQYHDLLEAIKERGSYKEPARAGMPGSTSLFGYQARFDLTDNFPIVTTKKIFWKGIVVELLWFLRGDTNIKYLDENKVTKMWHQDAYNFYVMNFNDRIIYGVEQENRDRERSKSPLTFEEFCKIINETPREELPAFMTNKGSYIFGDCGYQYGRVWRLWNTGKMVTTGHTGVYTENGIEVVDQIANIIDSLRSNPFGRRHVITAWDPAHDKELALTWCHALFQFNCRRITARKRCEIATQMGILLPEAFAASAEWDDVCDKFKVPKYYLDCQLYQRSADVHLGVPFNISSYALLTYIIAKIVNMVPGELIHTFGDVHIYDNHKEAVDEQLLRDPLKYQLPTLHLNEKIDWQKIGSDLSFDTLTLNDFELRNYESYPKLNSAAELRTGMKT